VLEDAKPQAFAIRRRRLVRIRMHPTTSTTAPTMKAGLISGACLGVPPVEVDFCNAHALELAQRTTPAARMERVI
jgi:hypothetical protein